MERGRLRHHRRLKTNASFISEKNLIMNTTAFSVRPANQIKPENTTRTNCMKTKTFLHPILTGLLLGALFALAPALRAADVLKANNTSNLNLGPSWVSLTPPTASDVGVWDATVLGANTVLLGADTNWAGIRITNVAGAVVISAGNTLTLGANGVDLNGAAQNLTLSCPLVLGVAQTWTVTNGRTLTVSGNVTNGANQLTIGGKGATTISGIIGSGTGAVVMAGTNTLILSGANSYTGGLTLTNGGTINPNNGAAFGSGGTLTLSGGTIYPTSGVQTYANPIFVTAGTTNNLFGYSGGGQYPKFTGAITGSGVIQNKELIGSLGNAFINGDISGFTGTFDVETGAGTGENFQFAGGTAASYNGSQAHFVVNGTGSGAFYIAETANAIQRMGDLSGTGGTISSVNAVELEVGALNTSTTYRGTIASSTLKLVKVGTGTFTLTGNNSYTGTTTVSNGVLSISNNMAAIASGSAITATSPGVFDLNNTSGSTLTFAKAVAGTGGLTKSGSGAVVLSAAQTFTGGTTVNAGALYVNNTGPNLANTVSVTANATLGGNGTNLGPVTVATGGIIEGGQAGAGTLTLSNLTFNGPGTIKASVAAAPYVPLIVTNVLAMSATPVTISIGNAPAPGTYHLVQYGSLAGSGGFALNPTRTLSLATNIVGTTNFLDLVVIPSPGYDVWTGGFSSEWSVNPITSPKNWNLISNGVALFATDFLTADTVIFDDSAANTNVNISVANVNPGSTTFNNTNNNYVVQGAYGIASGSVTKTGTGTLTISNVNTYLGGTTISKGIVSFASGGLGGGTVTLAGNSTLQWNGVNSAGLNLAVNSGVTATLDTMANIVAQSAAITGGGAVLKTGVGQLALSGANTYSNTTTISQGALMLNSATALPGSANVVLGDANSGATSPTLGMTFSEVISSLTVGANVANATLYLNAISANLNFNPTNMTLNSPLTMSVANNALGDWSQLDVIGGITGNGAGAGFDTLIITNANPSVQCYLTGDTTANSFLGNVHITGGRVRLQNINGSNLAIPATASVTLDSGTTLEFSTGALPELVDGLKGTGLISCNVSQASPFTVGESGGSGYFSGKIQNGTGSLGIIKDGAGTQVLAGTNIIYTGATTINGGILSLSNCTAFASAPTINAPGVLDLNNDSGTPWTWTNVVSGSGGLSKSGSGLVTITSTNSGFGGGSVVVNAGTLNLAGDLGTPTVVNVNSNATLSSIGGVVNSLVTVNNGGMISAPNYTTFTINGAGLILGTNATDNTTTIFSGDGTGFPGGIALPGGMLTLNGTNAISIIGVPPAAPGTYPLITYTTSAGSGTVVLAVPLPPGYTGGVTNNTSAGQVQLVLTAVQNLVWVGYPNNNWNTSASQVWKLSSSLTPSAFINNAVVDFDNTASNFVVNVTANVLPTSALINSSSNYTFTGSSLQFGGTLTKDGAGSLTLTTNNNLDTVDLLNGTLVALGSETFTNFTLANGTLQLGNGGTNGWVNLPATLNMPTNTTTLVFDRADDQAVGNTFTGNGGLIQLGSDTVTLTGESSFTGNITVNGGTLTAGVTGSGAASPFGQLVASSPRTITVNANGTLSFAAANVFGGHNNNTAPTLVINSNGVAINNVAGNNGLWDVVLNNGTLTSTAGSAATVGAGINPSRTYGAWDFNDQVTSTGASSITTIAGINGQSMLSSQGGTTTFNVQGVLNVSVPLIDGDLAGQSSGLTLTNSGELVLNGASSFTGPTAVGDGVTSSLLKLVNNTTWASDITLASPGALELSNSVAWTFANAISGNGTVTKSGPGTVAMTQAPSYSGATVVNGGSLLVPGLNSSASVTVNSGATFGGQGNVSGPVTISNGGGISAPYNTALSLSSLTLGANPTDVQTLTFSTDLTGVDGNINVSTSFSQSGTNLVNVTGALPLTAPATYTLITYPAFGAVNNGVFVLGSLPERGAGYLTNDTVNGLVQLVVTNLSGLEWVGSPTNSWDTAGTVDWKLANSTPTSFINNSDFVIFDDTASNFVVNVGAGVNPVMAIVTNVNTYTFQGSPLAVSAPFTAEGPGTMVLLANGNIFGALNLAGGTLQVGNGTNTGSISLPASPSTAIGTGATLAFDRSDAINLGNPFTGGGQLEQLGTGTLTLTNGNSDYSGGTVISQGTVAVGGSGSLGTGVITLGTVATGTNNVQLSFVNIPMVAGTYAFPDVIVTNGTGKATISGTANTSPNPVPNPLVELYRAVTLMAGPSGTYASDLPGSFTGPGAGAGNYSLIVDGSAGTVRTTAGMGGFPANDFVGNVLITNGLYQMQNQSYNGHGVDANNNMALPPIASVTVDATGTWGLTWTDWQAIDGLNGAGIVNVRANGGTLTTLILGSANGNGAFSGVIQNNASALATVKVGTGTQTFSGNNTYTGGTTVSNGTLAVNGSLPTGSAVYVASAGTMAGTGTIGGTVTVDGTLAPGTNGIGTMTVNNNLTLNAASLTTLAINRAAGTGTYGKVSGISTANLAGTLTVTSLGGTFQGGDSFTLIGASTYSGNFTTTNLPVLGSGKAWNWNPATGVLSVMTTVNTNPTNITATVSGGNLNLSWPADHTGWRLLVQTNHLAAGISSNTNDWMTVPGSAGIDQTNIPMDPTKPAEFYRLVYP